MAIIILLLLLNRNAIEFKKVKVSKRCNVTIGEDRLATAKEIKEHKEKLNED